MQSIATVVVGIYCCSCSIALSSVLQHESSSSSSLAPSSPSHHQLPQLYYYQTHDTVTSIDVAFIGGATFNDCLFLREPSLVLLLVVYLVVVVGVVALHCHSFHSISSPCPYPSPIFLNKKMISFQKDLSAAVNKYFFIISSSYSTIYGLQNTVCLLLRLKRQTLLR